MSEWQPIETAPRDGTWFVICRAGELESLEVGTWDTSYGQPSFVAAENGLYRKVDNRISGWAGFSNMHRATHWMPLPEPPAPGTVATVVSRMVHMGDLEPRGIGRRFEPVPAPWWAA